MRETMHGLLSGAGRMHPPFARPGSTRGERASDTALEMPPIENFLDELPSIDDYVLAGYSESADVRSIDDYLEDSSSAGDVDPFQSQSPPRDIDEEGWAIADWQSFNWNDAASLGSRSEGFHSSHAIDADGLTEDRVTARRANPREISPSADEVARALDGIARRIRSGELKIDRLTGAPPEAAMAAALASLLRMRD